MDDSGIEQIVGELCSLLDQQMDAVSGRGFLDLTEEELASYHPRKTRIAVLRVELGKFLRPI